MRIEKLSLNNFRCFEQRQFDLASQFNLIVGNNATGKTAILAALSIALSQILTKFPRPANTLRLIEERDIRQKFYLHGTSLTVEPQYPCRITTRATFGDRGSVEWNVGNYGGVTKLSAQSVNAFAKDSLDAVQSGSDRPLPAISYYGSERLWTQVNAGEVKTTSPLSRFAGYQDCLNSASDQRRLLEWFKTQEFISLQQKKKLPVLEACRDAIMTCVPGSSRVYFDVSYDQLILEINGEGVPFSFLSDGFRNMLALVADLAVRCATINPQFTSSAALKTEGVVLIDELDLHLHPTWQGRVVTDLMAAFPNIQFVATTHSPFVIQSLPPTQGVQLVNLDDRANENPHDKSVEDIAEWIQGVELPQRSRRYLDMMEKAKSYFLMLQDDSTASEQEKQATRDELQNLVMPYSDSPAYHAFIKMQELAAKKEASNEQGGTP